MILAMVGDKKQTNRQNMAEIVFCRGVSEMKGVISQQNNIIPYEIYNNYIKISIVFNPMTKIFRK